MWEWVGPVACDTYLLYHGCTRFTEILEGLNVGSTGLSVIYVWANEPGPTEMLPPKVENGWASKDWLLTHTIVDEEDDSWAVFGDTVIDEEGHTPVDMAFACHW